MTADSSIYVMLVNEGIDVWRPVDADKIDDNVFRIREQPYDRDDEKWEFEPGAVVECRPSTKGGKEVLVAYRLFSSD